MYRVAVTEHFGPFCGMGGYGSVTGVAFSKSPKLAHQRAERAIWFKSAGGGVPILRIVKMWRNNRLINERSV